MSIKWMETKAQLSVGNATQREILHLYPKGVSPVLPSFFSSSFQQIHMKAFCAEQCGRIWKNKSEPHTLLASRKLRLGEDMERKELPVSYNTASSGLTMPRGMLSQCSGLGVFELRCEASAGVSQVKTR